MKRAVALLGEEDVEDLLQEQGHVEVTCEFCNDCFQFQRPEMEAALAESKAGRDEKAALDEEQGRRFDQDFAALQVIVMPACQLSEATHFVACVEPVYNACCWRAQCSAQIALAHRLS